LDRPVAVDPVLLDLPDSIETERLTLRAPRPGDGPMVFEAVRDSLSELRRFPASMSWALAEPSVETSEKYCREAHANFVARRDLPLLLLERKTGVLVGSSGLHRIDWRVPKVEVGFWGRTPYNGRGLVTEGVGAIVELAFDALKARRVEAFCDEGERAQLPRLRAIALHARRDAAQRADRPRRHAAQHAHLRNSPLEGSR
jgi:RimJ/RimL family protein N-acetyltransferase